MKKISIIIPFYCGRNWLEEALDSVYNQTYNKFEVILINDGSKEYIDDLVKKYTNIIYIKQKNLGVSAARNRGLEKATGEYIAFLDSDDFWMTDKLKLQVEFMDKNDYIWSHHAYYLYFEATAKIKDLNLNKLSGDVQMNLLKSFKGQTSCFMIRRDIIVEHKIRFKNSINYGEDILFFLELSKLGNLGYINQTLGYFRVKKSNAGFNPKIQLRFRAMLYRSLRTDVIFKRLSTISKIAYKYCNIVDNNIQLNNKYIYYILYFLPWLIYKF